MQLCKYGNEDLKLKQEPDREAFTNRTQKMER